MKRHWRAHGESWRFLNPLAGGAIVVVVVFSGKKLCVSGSFHLTCLFVWIWNDALSLSPSFSQVAWTACVCLLVSWRKIIIVQVDHRGFKKKIKNNLSVGRVYIWVNFSSRQNTARTSSFYLFHSGFCFQTFTDFYVKLGILTKNLSFGNDQSIIMIISASCAELNNLSPSAAFAWPRLRSLQ